VSRLRQWLIAGLVLLLGRRKRPPQVDERERLVPPGTREPGAELLVVALLAATAVSAVAFTVVYAVDAIPNQTQFLGLALGLAFAFLAAAFFVASRRLVVTEELEEDYPPPGRPAEQEALDQLVSEGGDRLTRRRLLIVGGGAAGTALAAALVTPALSLGPALEIAPLYRTPWRRGVRLVDEAGRPLLAGEVEEETFYTAYPQGAGREQLGAPVVVVRLEPARLHLPDDRRDWAPDGILAYSKICTHAGCAIALYRKPTFPDVQPGPALVCPCHYSTFDPASGGTVLFGPAGRPLPQLPLALGPGGELRAAGTFSGAVGPSWWGVHLRKPS
jgi:ubiquinol-cytochrome c reductase iron-sulfur subunit